MFATLVTLALAAQPQATPRLYRSHHVSAALAAGCRVQHVHVPAGKIGSQPAIIRCPAAATTLARRD